MTGSLRLAHLVPSTAATRYTATPSPTTVAAVKQLHESVREVLGTGYDTFLQGSYRNGTAVPDINDVDIVALRRGTRSSYFTGSTPTFPVTWEEIFGEVQRTLESSWLYRGKTERGDKCITINTGFHADVVPAVYIDSEAADPIAIYSFRDASERKNFPRDHYRNNVEKQDRTDGAYKPTVRMFKRWVRNWFSDGKVAPSFYVECLLHGVPDDKFSNDPVLSFFFVGSHIVQNVSRSTIVPSVAGDKDILTSSEWHPDRYEKFSAKLITSLLVVAKAIETSTQQSAQAYWREAFGD